MRKTSLIVGGKEITDPLTIKFNVPFGEHENVDTVEIKVYNLKDSTINGIATNTRAILSAGYVDDNGVIFNGTLKKKETKWEELDKITFFHCSDATDDYTSAVFKKTYARNTKASVILQDLAQAAGLTIGDIDLPIDFVYRSGKVLNGKIKILASEIAKDCKAKLFINKGQMFVREKSKGDNVGLDISKATGLIDQPEEIVEEKEDKVIKKGYKLKMLLNPRITTDAIIKLTSKKVSGTFRVAKGEHKSDGDTYYTECEVVPA
jgi:hypothetical protein